MAHLVSPRSKGLFQGAISQSGWPQTFPYSVAKAVTKDVGTDTILAPSRRCSGPEAPKTESMLVRKLNRLNTRNTDGVHRPPQYPLHISLSQTLSLSQSAVLHFMECMLTCAISMTHDSYTLTTKACFRNLTTKELLLAQGAGIKNELVDIFGASRSWGPVVDGTNYPTGIPPLSRKYFDRMRVTLPALKSFIECPSTTPFRISCPIQDFLSEFVFGCKLHQKLHLTLWFMLTCAVPDMTGI